MACRQTELRKGPWHPINMAINCPKTGKNHSLSNVDVDVSIAKEKRADHKQGNSDLKLSLRTRVPLTPACPLHTDRYDGTPHKEKFALVVYISKYI